MNRTRDSRGIFTRGSIKPTTISPTLSCGTLRATTSTNPSTGRSFTRGEWSVAIVTSQPKEKTKFGEERYKETIPKISQEVVILSSHPQEEELIDI